MELTPIFTAFTKLRVYLGEWKPSLRSLWSTQNSRHLGCVCPGIPRWLLGPESGLLSCRALLRRRAKKEGHVWCTKSTIEIKWDAEYIKWTISGKVPDLIWDWVDLKDCILYVGWLETQVHARRPFFNIRYDIRKASFDARVYSFGDIHPIQHQLFYLTLRDQYFGYPPSSDSAMCPWHSPQPRWVPSLWSNPLSRHAELWEFTLEKPRSLHAALIQASLNPRLFAWIRLALRS